ncbi:MAG: amidohydrolase [Candidatus Riflebacteria bacterium]|nr:amidohydrolase [Candidatus Riflebacteria bacterium]
MIVSAEESINHPTLFFHCSGRDLPDYAHKSFDSFLVENGKIIRRDFGLETMSRFRGYTQFDLGGEVVLPAFADVHTHFMQTGLMLVGCRLDRARSLDEVFDRLHTFAAAHPDLKWILAWNLDESELQENRLPTVAELDAVLPAKNLWLSRIDLHSAVPNSHAMAWAQSILPSAALVGGRFCMETYAFLSTRLQADLPVDFKRRGLELARTSCHEHGIGTVHALEGGDECLNADVALVSDFLLEPELHGVIYHQSLDPTFALQHGWNRLGGCLFIDGSFGSRTAALCESYTDDPENNGMLYKSRDDVEELLRCCRVHDLQLAMHCIGDRAIDFLTEIHVNAFEKFGPPPLPHRIEHFELPDDTALRRVREASLFISVQPAFEALWGGIGRMYDKRLGAERVLRTNPFRTLLDCGIPIAGGSDSPVTPLDPFLGIDGFVNHPNPDERIDLNSALSAFILEPHRFAGEDADRGRLGPGFRADFVTLPSDPFLTTPSKLRELRTSRLFLEGRPVGHSPSKGV